MIMSTIEKTLLHWESDLVYIISFELIQLKLPIKALYLNIEERQ